MKMRGLGLWRKKKSAQPAENEGRVFASVAEECWYMRKGGAAVPRRILAETAFDGEHATL